MTRLELTDEEALVLHQSWKHGGGDSRGNPAHRPPGVPGVAAEAEAMLEYVRQLAPPPSRRVERRRREFEAGRSVAAAAKVRRRRFRRGATKEKTVRA